MARGRFNIDCAASKGRGVARHPGGQLPASQADAPSASRHPVTPEEILLDAVERMLPILARG